MEQEVKQLIRYQNKSHRKTVEMESLQNKSGKETNRKKICFNLIQEKSSTKRTKDFRIKEDVKLRHKTKSVTDKNAVMMDS